MTNLSLRHNTYEQTRYRRVTVHVDINDVDKEPLHQWLNADDDGEFDDWLENFIHNHLDDECNCRDYYHTPEGMIIAVHLDVVMLEATNWECC